ncbi:MAG: PQQ-binding-like beta-propeller repeat protein, partial [Phycisphaerae bacterium]|nr:PQQ-binding-like beta-propeller repeat protein [Phycisphaerae bacterium]
PQWPWINTLMAMNGYNGAILWKRKLNPDFMIHRNTIIATPKTLYLGDNVSCKLLDAATGELKGEIKVPADISDGPVWKWMGLEGGILYALVGENEPRGETLKGTTFRGAGWPWWGMNKYQWGFGRTIIAIDPTTRKILWHHRETESLDSRGMCMKNGRIFFYSHKKFVGCLDAKTGKVLWKVDAPETLEAIGEHFGAQHFMWGFSHASYVMCNDKALYFVGVQRKRIVALAAGDGKLLWQHPFGNYQSLLRDDGLYAMGSRQPSVKFDLLTGKSLGELAKRYHCTRATGSIDRIFVRAGAGTLSWDVKSGKQLGISPMRPGCQDGVVISSGHLYWGPWICGCPLSLVGSVTLAPAGDFDYTVKATEAERLEAAEDAAKVAPLAVAADDWPAYRRDNARGVLSKQTIGSKASVRWRYKPRSRNTPAAPVTAGGLVFVAGSDGVVRALVAASGKKRWVAYTGGAVRFPPAIADGRALMGSGDGWVYAFEAVSGRLLWRFRAAPVERKISVHGALMSTWPVGSGVLAEDGTVYAAAGIA